MVLDSLETNLILIESVLCIKKREQSNKQVSNGWRSSTSIQKLTIQVTHINNSNLIGAKEREIHGQ